MTKMQIKLDLPDIHQLVERGKKIVDVVQQRGQRTVNELTERGTQLYDETLKRAQTVLTLDQFRDHALLGKAIHELEQVRERALKEVRHGLELANEKLSPALDSAMEAVPEPMRKTLDQVIGQVRTLAEEMKTVPDQLMEFARKHGILNVVVSEKDSEKSASAEKADAATEAVAVDPEPEAAAPAAAELSPPFEGYDELNVRQVTERLSEMTPEELTRVREYEQATKNRVTVLRAVEKLLEESTQE
jgi:hypothetical protein